MNTSLSVILNLVGELDDSPGSNTPRERFRKFLKENVGQLDILRDYIEECLKHTEDQYNRAFQDLVNRLGEFLGFEVEFGRYRGIQGEIGFDGLWKSPSGFNIVVEVKKTEVYAIKTSILLGYINELISEKRITDPDKVLGLYVIGRADPEASQLEKTIIAERKTHILRIISIESLLSLAELMKDYDISHDDILTLIKPSGPSIDPIAEMIVSLVAEEKARETYEEKPGLKEETIEERQYWIAPVKGDDVQTAEENIKTLVGDSRVFAFGDRSPGRKYIKPGDFICFYAQGKGIVAHAEVASYPENKPHPKVRYPEKYHWIIQLKNVKLYLDNPIAIDASLRSKLKAFFGFGPRAPWSWFVHATRRVSREDFMLLTGQQD